ncbi:MAG: methyltransferase domain-containing protein [Deltaproteobacteria bacterium]|nr:methyltransferase domain-containing protein [Deltaproteobacteria bacterium]
MTPIERFRAPQTELNFELYFVTEVLGLRSLHYGYWDEPKTIDRVDLEEMGRGQARFTERLLELVPPDVKSVLDVGAGIGDNARALSRAGHRVTALSPDRNHERYFAACDDPNVSFRRTTFETFETAERFDLVLFSESHNYFDRRFGLRKAHDLLRPSGRLLVSGMFRSEDGTAYASDFDVSEHPYVRMAAEAGFETVQISDITPNVLPTVEMIDRAVTEILEPTLRFAEAYAAARAPWKTRLFRVFLARDHDAIRRALKKLRRKTDPDRFRARIRYATILFQKS